MYLYIFFIIMSDLYSDHSENAVNGALLHRSLATAIASLPLLGGAVNVG
jgi:hypothetical protein